MAENSKEMTEYTDEELYPGKELLGMWVREGCSNTWLMGLDSEDLLMLTETMRRGYHKDLVEKGLAGDYKGVDQVFVPELMRRIQRYEDQVLSVLNAMSRIVTRDIDTDTILTPFDLVQEAIRDVGRVLDQIRDVVGRRHMIGASSLVDAVRGAVAEATAVDGAELNRVLDRLNEADPSTASRSPAIRVGLLVEELNRHRDRAARLVAGLVEYEGPDAGGLDLDGVVSKYRDRLSELKRLEDETVLEDEELHGLVSCLEGYEYRRKDSGLDLVRWALLRAQELQRVVTRANEEVTEKLGNDFLPNDSLEVRVYQALEQGFPPVGGSGQALEDKPRGVDGVRILLELACAVDLDAPGKIRVLARLRTKDYGFTLLDVVRVIEGMCDGEVPWHVSSAVAQVLVQRPDVAPDPDAGEDWYRLLPLT